MNLVCFVLLFTQATLFMVAGFAGFVAFLVLDNKATAVACFTTGVLNGLMMHMHLLRYQKRTADYYPPLLLQILSHAALVVLVLAILSFVAYCILEAMSGFKPVPAPSQYTLQMIGCLVAVVSAVLLMVFCGLYKSQEETARLLDGTAASEGYTEVGGRSVDL